MCSTCGCAEGNLYIEGDEHRPHSAFRSAPFSPAPRPAAALTGITFAPQRSDAGDLHYGHGEAGTHAPGMSQRQMLDVEINVLDKNNRLAERNRARFAARKQLVLNLVSSPGSGKTTLGKVLLGLQTPNQGQVTLLGETWSPASERVRRPRRRVIQTIVQDPLGSFNPHYTVGEILCQPLRLAGITQPQVQAEQCRVLLALTGLSSDYLDRRPSQLSGGQRQRHLRRGLPHGTDGECSRWNGSMAWYGLCGMLWRWRGLAFHRPGEKGRRPVCDARLSDYSQLRRQ